MQQQWRITGGSGGGGFFAKGDLEGPWAISTLIGLLTRRIMQGRFGVAGAAVRADFSSAHCDKE